MYKQLMVQWSDNQWVNSIEDQDSQDKQLVD